MNSLLLLVVVLLALPATAVAQIKCADYETTIASPISFAAAVASLKAAPAKDEFETSADYEARIAASGNTETLVVLKKIENKDFINYDADGKILTVKSYAFDNANARIWQAERNSEPKFKISMSNRDVVISQAETIGPSYEAQNSYGAKFTVAKVVRSLKAIVEPEQRGVPIDLFAIRQSDGVVAAISMPPSEAKEIKLNGQIAFVIRPMPPYIVRSTYPGDAAKVRSPSDVTINAEFLIADFHCALLMTAEGKVIASFPTR
ncbi:MAG: hypothetical protein ACT4QA_13505 [Panacagrimonas sp.]